MNESKWIINPIHPEANKLSNDLEIPIELASILIRKGIRTSEEGKKFLFPSIEDLHPPFLMKDMQKAVERIKKAKENNEKILIFGDYDADGITSTLILYKCLKNLGTNVFYYIPHRIKEGYGIKKSSLEYIEDYAPDLVITVDNGIKAIDFVNEANKKGIDVIIADHHVPGDELPPAFAVLNPLQRGCFYPFKNLAGVGVTFKLVQSLLQEFKKDKNVRHYLKIASIGTIADLAELQGENRTIVKLGLKELGNPYNNGLKNIIEISGLTGKEITTYDISFKIGPRINASGRLASPYIAIELFLTESQEESLLKAKELDKLNTQRQQIEENILKEIMDKIKEIEPQKRKILIFANEGWHRGVIGVVASKIAEKYRRPAILISIDDNNGYGSGRSIESFSLIDALKSSEDLFKSWGGHKMAAGFEIQPSKIPLLEERLTEYCETHVDDEVFTRKYMIDSCINFDRIDNVFIDYLEMFSPFGIGNPRPVFFTDNVTIKEPPAILKGKYLKLFLFKKNKFFDALIWENTEDYNNLKRGEKINIIFYPQRKYSKQTNEFFLNILDIKKI
ncbi:MAG: single-stranded-DNA-specific exonuclease RecJ [Acidobacteriota bacterium]